MKRIHHDYDLENLLELNEVVYYIQKGKYWVKFEAKKVTPIKNIPHGIKYCLTLHDKDNKRILGYDNAHDCLPKLRKYRAKKEKWDHVHKKNKVYYYEFDTPSQLVEDFWRSVESFI